MNICFNHDSDEFKVLNTKLGMLLLGKYHIQLLSQESITWLNATKFGLSKGAILSQIHKSIFKGKC
jgi:hypothetical protein